MRDDLVGIDGDDEAGSAVPGTPRLPIPFLLGCLDRAEIDLLPPNFSAVRFCSPNSSTSMPSTRWYQEAEMVTSRQVTTRCQAIDGEAHVVSRNSGAS